MKKLDKDKKLNKKLEREINEIDQIDDMNETISMLKEKKTSAMELAEQAGTKSIIEHIQNGASLDSVFSKNKSKLWV